MMALFVVIVTGDADFTGGGLLVQSEIAPRQLIAAGELGGVTAIPGLLVQV